MKNYILILCIALLCSCSLFKKQVKTTAKTESISEVGKSEIKNDVDTSKTFYKETIKFTIPSTAQNLPQFVAPYFPNLGVSELRNTTEELQKRFDELAKGKKISNDNDAISPYDLKVEFERLYNQEAYKYKQEAKRDTATNKVNTETVTKTKEPIRSELAIAIIAIICIAIYLFFKK